MSRLDKQTLARLSDTELREELERRRTARARGRRAGPSMDTKQIAQLMRFYANLELEPGASLEQVEEAYKRLMKKYHPSKHRGDAKKHKAAKDLTESLTKAYQGLVEHKEKQARRKRRR